MDIRQEQFDVVNGFDSEAAWLELVGLERAHKLSSDSSRELPLRFNGHMHTTESFNPLGRSPLGAVLHAKLNGWSFLGTAEFDTDAGAKAARAAGYLLGLRTFCAVETRVVVPWVPKGVEINSPGEPQIAYHAFMGFPTRRRLPEETGRFLFVRGRAANVRNETIVREVNDAKGFKLDLRKHVHPLTPHGNITERHICSAYAQHGHKITDPQDQSAWRKSDSEFWAEKLQVDVDQIDLETPFALELLIREKLMKKGGPGYVEPTSGMFPEISLMNQAALLCGAMPTVMWLNGIQGAEADVESFLDQHMADGVCAVCIIPERNLGGKLVHLEKLVAAASDRGLLIIPGTELNKPGQWEYVHCEETNDLLKFSGEFGTSLFAAYGHQVLLDWCGFGLTSEWAKKKFPTLKERKAFFAQVGKAIDPAHEEEVASLSTTTPISGFPGQRCGCTA